MKPNNPLQVLKAAPRYATIPIKRWSRKAPALVVFIGPKPLWGIAIKDRPAARLICRTPQISQFEFNMSLAPWILADRRASVVTVDAAPGYLKTFCQRHRVPLSVIAPPKKKASTPAAAKPKPVIAQPSVPNWYNRDQGVLLKQALRGGRPVFLYMPWIPEHGDAVIEALVDDGYALAPFDLIRDVADNIIRREAFRFARQHPDLYRRMVIRRLAPIAGQVSGFILTFDWAPITRIIVEACKVLGIPTILVPHESAFISQSLYYRDPLTNASMPACDVTLAWGQLQKDIFIFRGYEESRVHVVGAPKFDTYSNSTSQIDRDRFHRLFGLSPERSTILFATQSLDSQTDTQVARSSQRAAIRDLLRYAETHDGQLLVRLPPSRDDILGVPLRQAIAASDHAAVDDGEYYLMGPEETVRHVDVVTSINSTMLFEGLMAGKPAISMRYIEFDSIWDDTGVAVARDLNEASDLLDQVFGGTWARDDDLLQGAAKMFGVGQFDGKAASRIKTFLRDQGPNLRDLAGNTALDRVKRGLRIDIAAIPQNRPLQETTQKYLRELINANTLLRSPPKPTLANAAAFSGVDVFLQWGAGDTPEKIAQRAFARLLGKPTVVIEDGLIRSIDIGLSLSPGLSLLVDDRTAYYDATRPSQLETQLQAGPELSSEERNHARATIDKIVSARISKYNHAPDGTIELGRPAVLVVDQRMDDSSIALGIATADDFERMVLAALAEWPDHDVIVKQHPDTSLGGRPGYLTPSRLTNAAINSDRIRMVDQAINPHDLFDLVDDVYVVTSGMGFEALMAGKRVHCFGLPFYAGWGLTDDRKLTRRRSRSRTLEEVFHFTYVRATRYFDPETEELVSPEDFVDFMVRQRDRPNPAIQQDSPQANGDLTA
ncbi:hypothetical protein EGY25_06320 [Brevundimonas intermedia]|uniref:Capsular polysaccharide biosynthesis protein n=1 Tax=Brevundimonas intermedia TaxID=74315 RepID=A0A4Y9RWT7_9CAUL|nr:hypothetical protein [Brevundimonas intermedia]TFW13544.1 hypothetical protein EGY25_06320 [Brevundimonas intermedia]